MIIRGEVKLIAPYRFPLIMAMNFAVLWIRLAKVAGEALRVRRLSKSVSVYHKTGTDRLFIQLVGACFYIAEQCFIEYLLPDSLDRQQPASEHRRKPLFRASQLQFRSCG